MYWKVEEFRELAEEKKPKKVNLKFFLYLCIYLPLFDMLFHELRSDLEIYHLNDLKVKFIYIEFPQLPAATNNS